MPLVTKKPCIDICEFDRKDKCKACGRTREEKKVWKQMSAEEKDAVWRRVLGSHGVGKGKEARALRALYDKAVKKAIRKEEERRRESH